MTEQTAGSNDNQLRYSCEESPPTGLSVMLAAQFVVLIIAGIVIAPAIVLRAAKMPVSMEAGVIFFALFISGLTTMIQARKIWRFGAGYILLMGTSGAFIAVCITALEEGGMSLLMTLIVISSLIQFVFANHLSMLRRIVTPLVGGTCIMLLGVTVMPYAFREFVTVGGQAGYEAPVVAFVTLSIILGLSFFGGSRLRLWAPVIGIVFGSLLSGLIGDFDGSRITAAAWVGIPQLSWTGFDLSFDRNFWVLIPAFCIVTIVGAIETYGDSIAIQDISHHKARPVNFKTVQGALYADGLGNFLSGCVGTMPNTTYSTSISVVDITGVASRKVGLFCGIIMLVLAFFPKVYAVILSIPGPVVGSYLMVLILLIFMHGIRMVTKDGLTYEKGFIVGIGFWLGTGFQQKMIFNESIPDWLAPITGNGMTSGTVLTLLLMAVLNLKGGRKRTLKTHLNKASLPQIQRFVDDFCLRQKWSESTRNRLQLAAEETLLAMLGIREKNRASTSDKMNIELRRSGVLLEMDVAVASVDANMEELIGLAKGGEMLSIQQLPFQILGLVTEDIKHMHFHGFDFICMKVKCGSALPVRSIN
jgi:xanthine permease XanP